MIGWLDDAKRHNVAHVAAELGLDVQRDGRSFGPCVACGVATRANSGRRDRRGRCRIFPDGSGWACCSNGSDGCGARGDGPGLVAWCLTGKPWSKGDASTAVTVREWFAAKGWADDAPRLPPPREPRALSRPPACEVAALWDQCGPVTADPDVAAWLARHADGPIDAAAVEALDLARALPLDLPELPGWARYRGVPWSASGHRLIVQAFQARSDEPGRLRRASLHARNVLPDCALGDKAAWPAGADARGLVFAARGMGGLPLAELAEGVPDFLRLAIEVAALPIGQRPVVLGVVAGSASLELAAAVPQGWTVAIRTHADASGDRYAARWAELLAGRDCTLHRQRKANRHATPEAAPVDAPARDREPTAPEGFAAWPLWSQAVLDAVGTASGESLALIWCLIVRDCGRAERVPLPVKAAHQRAVEALPAVEADYYRAKLRDLGGFDG